MIYATHTHRIDELGGVLKRMPLTGFTFFIGSISICGLPPFNGFISELFIYMGSFKEIVVGDFDNTSILLPIITILALVTIGGLENKKVLLPAITELSKLGCVLYATLHTSQFLDENKIPNRLVHKISANERPNIETLLRERRFDLVINIPSMEKNYQNDTDGEEIRKLTVKNNVLLVTSVDVAKHTVQGMKEARFR